jgi:hypothetical protein
MTSALQRYDFDAGEELVQYPDGRWIKSDDADMSLFWAKAIIEKIGTTGAEDTNTIREADKWLKRYFPEQ